MAGEIKLNSVTALTESGSNIVLNNVDTATNRTNLGLGSLATQSAITNSQLASGMIIETIHLPCSGQSQTVGSGTYTSETVSAVQQLSASFDDVTGSSITYTPPSSASRVIYSFSFQFSFTDAFNVGIFKLFLDGTEVTNAKTEYGGENNLEGRFTFTWPFAIGDGADAANGKVSAWATGKIIKLQAAEIGGNNEAAIHQVYYWPGGATYGIPTIKIDAIV
jgi:hypothetical protein